MGPSQVYLRDRKGSPLGPLEPSALEVLFCADVVDAKTPVSVDGRTFIPLERHPELSAQVIAARDKLAEGLHPWDSGVSEVADPAEGLLEDEEASEVPTDPPPPPSESQRQNASPTPPAEPPPTPVRVMRPSRPTEAPPAPPAPVSRRPAPARVSRPPPAADTQSGLDLSVHPAARILFDHAIERSTGRLRFSTDFGRIDCCLVGGIIGLIETDMDLLALDQFLINKGAVTEDAITRARRKMPDAELGHALIGLGLIPPHVFMDALGRWARTTLSWIVALEEGRAEFIPESLSSPAVPTGLDRFSCLVQAIREGVQRDQIIAAFREHLDAPLIRSQLSGVEVSELKLDPREVRILRSVEGARTVGEILESLKSSEVALLSQRALFIGFVSRFLVAGEARVRSRVAAPAPEPTPEPPPPAAPPPRSEARTPATPPPRTSSRRSPLAPPGSRAAKPAAAPAAAQAPVSPPPPDDKPEALPRPVAAPNDAFEALRLTKEFEAIKTQDPFQVLGVEVATSDTEVRQKFMLLAKKYHPDAAPLGTGDQVLGIRQEIFAFLQHVYDQIKTEAQRSEFKLLVDEGLKNREEEQEMVRAILDAETCFLKAEAMVKSRRWKEALAELEEGLSLKRGDREMEIYKAYVEAMIDGAYPKGIRRINELLGKDENLLAAFLFLARLHKSAGDMDAAIKMFKRVLQMDSHNNEAASEIRLVNMRKEKEKKKGRWF